jgi:hypothetical protein
MIDWEGRRIEPCACGGYLVSAVRDEAIVRAVWHHQRTAKHLDWSARQGYPQPNEHPGDTRGLSPESGGPVH